MNYSFTQHVLNGFGRNINTRAIRIAQNNKSISEVEFERMVIDLVTQAQKSYWDLVFTAEDLKVKEDSLKLAEKTLSDNQRQVDVGTLARIDLIQSQTQVATRREERIVSTFTQNQIQDQIKKVLSRAAGRRAGSGQRSLRLNGRASRSRPISCQLRMRFELPLRIVPSCGRRVYNCGILRSKSSMRRTSFCRPWISLQGLCRAVWGVRKPFATASAPMRRLSR